MHSVEFRFARNAGVNGINCQYPTSPFQMAAYPASTDRSCQAGAQRVSRTRPHPRERTGKGKSEPRHVGGCQEDGLLHACGGAQTAGLRACRGVQPHYRSVKTFPQKREKQKIGIHQRAGCQVPPIADWARDHISRLLRIVSGLAENTNSIICDGSSGLRQQMDVRSCRDAGTTSREALMCSEGS
jgi:hypothetical protein